MIFLYFSDVSKHEKVKKKKSNEINLTLGFDCLAYRIIILAHMYRKQEARFQARF